jgi:hypothetical protein
VDAGTTQDASNGALLGEHAAYDPDSAENHAEQLCRWNQHKRCRSWALPVIRLPVIALDSTKLEKALTDNPQP